MDSFIDYLTFNLMKLVTKLMSLKSSDNEEELLEEKKDDDLIKEEESQFFNKITIFDELMKLEVEIGQIKHFSEEKYKFFMEKHDEIKKKAEKFYENDASLNTPGYQLRLSVGIDPLGDLEMLKLIKTLASDIEYYKENELNYIIISKRLESLIEMTKKAYLVLLAKPDISTVNSANNAFKRIFDDASQMKFAKNEMKQEEICDKFCKAAYLLYKCNIICGDIPNIFSDWYKDLYNKEKLAMFKIFQNNTEKLLKMLETFSNSRYYKALKMYFLKLTSKKVEDDFLGYEDFKNFIKNEKKVYELYLHYANKDKNKVSILRVEEYFAELSRKYPSNSRIQFFITVIGNLKFDLSSYELYKLIYIFGLKTFCNNYIKTEEFFENDLIKETFENNNEEITFSDISSSNSYIEIYALQDEEEEKKVSKKLENLQLDFIIYDYKFVCLNKSYFKGCENILKNLRSIKINQDHTAYFN